MARADIINRLYSANKTPLEFQFQSLVAPPLLSLLPPYDIKQLNDIAKDPKLTGKINKKLEYIKNILQPRGFVKFHSGTNRVVYRFLEDQSFLIKVALDRTGLSDNPAEFQNQFILAPFVTKVFESTPCGTVGLFERVEPITSRQEFISIADDVFDLINDKFIGEYVLEDIGADYFMNWGIRRGFGPVLLDFPYCYKLDGNKLYCNKVDPFTRIPCGGLIDYDNGFNNLVCTKCGAKIFARDLQANIDKQNIILKGRKEYSSMKVKCIIPGQKPVINDTTISSKTYAKQVREEKKSTMKIEIRNNNPAPNPKDEVKELVARSKAAKEAAEAEKNKVKYQFNSKASAPFGMDTDPTSVYVNMNKDDDEDNTSTPDVEVEADSNEENPVEDTEIDNEETAVEDEDVDNNEEIPAEDDQSDKDEEVVNTKSSSSNKSKLKDKQKSSEQVPVGVGFGDSGKRNFIKEAEDLLGVDYDGMESKYPAKKKKSSKSSK